MDSIDCAPMKSPQAMDEIKVKQLLPEQLRVDYPISDNLHTVDAAL